MSISTIVVLSVLYCYTKADTDTPPPTTIPPLEFSCSNGKVDNIFGNGILADAVVVHLANGKMCRISNDLCVWKGKQKQIHVLYDKNETKAKVVEGHPHYFELKCKTGYVATASAVPLLIGLTTPQYIHKEAQPSDKPAIKIEIHKGNQKLNTAVEIGESLLLKIMGQQNSKILPFNCNARAVHIDDPYVLWDNKTCKSKDTAIMADKWTLVDGLATIQMNAFRFVESASVTIECSANICPNDDTECIDVVNGCFKNRRRRRSSDQGSNELNAYKKGSSTVTFTVVDRSAGTNNSEVISGNILMFVTAVIITLCVHGRQ